MAWFSAKKKGGRVGVLGFLRRVVAATMGCFFGCFRTEDSHYHLVSTPMEHMSSRNKNALSSLFLSDESNRDSDVEKGEGGNKLFEEVDFRELKDEAKFLKACGTLLETPVEIRKFSGKHAGISTHKEKSTTFVSRILSASIEKLKVEKQPDESLTPVKICEEWVDGEDSFVGTPRRRDSISSIQNVDIQNAVTPKDVLDNKNGWSAISSVSSGAFATTVRRTNKSVRFECQSDSYTSSSENFSQQSKKSESSRNSSVSKPSPYPTPLKLTDEMQTPGTVYPAYVSNIADGKTTKIRCQYVYSVLNPIEYKSQRNGLEGENVDPNLQRESLKPNDEATTPMSGMSKEGILVGNHRKEELSLSHWLKADSVGEGGNYKHLSLTSGEKAKYGITPGNRPILGMVAAHWNDEDGTHISPKWDGNGIPNTTTKYKEDQKVSWHATPFEERLEKALCEDTLISQRGRLSGTPPVDFSETEECKAAASSQVQSF